MCSAIGFFFLPNLIAPRKAEAAAAARANSETKPIDCRTRNVTSPRSSRGLLALADLVPNRRPHRHQTRRRSREKKASDVRHRRPRPPTPRESPSCACASVVPRSMHLIGRGRGRDKRPALVPTPSPLVGSRRHMRPRHGLRGWQLARIRSSDPCGFRTSSLSASYLIESPVAREACHGCGAGAGAGACRALAQ